MPNRKSASINWELGIFHLTLAIFSALAFDSQSGKQKAESVPAPQGAPRPTLSGAAARRNENVAVSRIDNDALKEANTRLGSNYTILTEAPVESTHFAAEHGRPASEMNVLRPVEAATGWHGEAFWTHQNSVFNARTFFQAGPVKPSRQNQYGGRFTGDLGRLGSLGGAFTQRKIRGMVNGNVLVPHAGERTPTATDPRLRTLIERYLAAYPAELPNRPDFDERALNTNAPQLIDEITGNLRLDRDLTSKTRLFLFHAIGRQYVDAFQLVAGQNPDMNVHNHRARTTVNHTLSPATELSLGIGFTRVRSALYPEPNAVGPRVRMGYQIEELGPDSQFPINRAQNTIRFGLHGSHRTGGGRHTLSFGGDGSRFQLNGVETNNQRGVMLFISNFGQTAIENLRAGVATTYEVTIGEMARGFRNWSGNAYFAGQWRASSRLQLYYGLRYSLEGAPNEVRGLNEIPYGSDGNNLSPRFHIALQLPGEWVLRTGYSVSFGQILPVTYQQVRYNAPYAFYLQVQNPDPLDPLRGLNLADPNLRSSPTWLSPDLVSPYAQQYGLALERKLLAGNLRLGYFGSRSFKLLNVFVQNRAVPVAGIDFTTATVNERRPNPRYYEEKHIVNAGIAYLDGGQVAFELPRWHGITLGASYTFSKALDEGSDYVTTAANRDLSAARAQSQYESLKDRRGLAKNI